ncbi:MAG: energy-coupling factor transporter ATPase [Clostridia bacterium]|nr:energy-coupling factor transporter ATPase [Clostridia bacterium]
MEAIKFENVSFKYGQSDKPVINNLNLCINKGEYVCMLGKNGSGKSTIARLMNGLLLPESGKVTVFDYDTLNKSTIFEVRKRVGMVFQNPDNQMVATIVEDDIAFGPENIGVKSQEIGERIDFALNSTNMQKFRFTAGQKLSGGQKQRVAIAGVLAILPEVIILDESTSMLDAVGRKEVLSVIKELNEKGITVISVTHYMDEAVEADKIYVISHGEIAMQGTPSEVFKDVNELKKFGLELPKSAYIATKLKENGLPIRDGVLTGEELAEELCKLFQKI